MWISTATNGHHLPSDVGLSEYQAAHRELRALLNEWDPIGVAAEVEDEYDCLIPYLYKRLRRGAREQQLLAFLTEELVERFGLEPRPEADRRVAAELVSWWDERRGAA